MRRTVVIFSLRVPVISPKTAASTVLDQLVEGWRAIKGVKEVRIDWKALPNSGSTDLTACVEAAVELEAETSKGLQRLYNKLTRAASKEPGRLASRTCTLNDLF